MSCFSHSKPSNSSFYFITSFPQQQEVWGSSNHPNLTHHSHPPSDGHLLPPRPCNHWQCAEQVSRAAGGRAADWQWDFNLSINSVFTRRGCSYNSLVNKEENRTFDRFSNRYDAWTELFWKAASNISGLKLFRHLISASFTLISVNSRLN